MSLVSKGYFLTVTLVDASGENKATLRYPVVAEDFTELQTNAATILAALNPVTDAVIVAYSLGEKFGEDASFVAAEGVEIENVAVISTRIYSPQEKWATIKIPAPNIGIFEGATGTGRNRVDNQDADLLTYLNLWTVTTGICTLSDGETIYVPGLGNTKGKRVHRASRKG
jgi:hypothetical protein